MMMYIKKKSATATWCAPDVAERMFLYELAEPPKCHARKKKKRERKNKAASQVEPRRKDSPVKRKENKLPVFSVELKSAADLFGGQQTAHRKSCLVLTANNRCCHILEKMFWKIDAALQKHCRHRVALLVFSQGVAQPSKLIGKSSTKFHDLQPTPGAG